MRTTRNRDIIQLNKKGKPMRKGIPESMEAEAGVKNLVDYVSEAARPVYLTQDGRPKAVIVDIDSYNALLDAVEGSEQGTAIPESDLTFVKAILHRSRSMRHHA